MKKEIQMKVYKEGFNIYAFKNKLKKQMRWSLKTEFPDEVIVGVCNQFLKTKPIIRNHWSWFIRVMRLESDKYFASKHIQEHQRMKHTTPSLKDILDANK